LARFYAERLGRALGQPVTERRHQHPRCCPRGT
jgi:hypothetical protein